jgi:adenylate cyclase
MKLSNNKLLVCAVVAVAVAIVLSFLFSVGVFSGWQLKLSDALYKEKSPLKNIVIVAIDDTSLQDIGRWPWPREKFVELIPKLAGSEVIGIDVAFFEDYDKIVDEQLGDAVAKAGNVVLPVEYTEFKDGKGTKLLKTIEPIANGALLLGFVNVFSDGDGITRAIPLRITGANGAESHDSFALAVYKAMFNKTVDIGGKEGNRMLINFVDKPGTFRTVSASDVLNDKTDEKEFENKIVLIGATSPDLHDDYFVPTSSGKSMSGVELHANALQTMITRQFLQNEARWLVILTIFIAAIATALALWKLRLALASGAAAVLFIVYLIFAIKMFDRGAILNIIYPAISILVTYVGIVARQYVISEKDRRHVLGLFGKYVSKDVANEIMKHAQEGISSLKGTEREISVLFSDIRGFTAVSETLKPREVVAMLNSYLGEMTKVVFKYKGTLDKFIGDCVMAVFNAPVEQKDHALLAVKAAVEMQEKIKRVHALKGRKIPIMHCGIGINTGHAVIGNIGTKDRMDYTSIGDSVNLASRLCSFAKPGQIVVSKSTYDLVKAKVVARKLGEIKVKGKEKPVVVYEIKKLK